MKRGNEIIFPGSDFKMEYHAKPEFEHPDDDTWDKPEKEIVSLYGERICEWCTVKAPCSECPNRYATPLLSPESRFKEFIKGKLHGKEKKNV